MPGLQVGEDGRHILHATTVEVGGRALAIIGPAGSGKSGLAAQVVMLGGGLVVDDMTVLQKVPSGDGGGAHLMASAPSGHGGAMELRGFGIVPMTLSGPRPLRGILRLGAFMSRLPEATTIIDGVPVRVFDHPATADLAAKIMLWLPSG